MERIVNGHYADSESTRDITGLSPSQFATIITALQSFYKGLENLMTATPEERRGIVEMMLQSSMSDSIGGLTPDNINERIMKHEETLISNYNNAYDILAVINQPYPGAEYNAEQF